MDRIQLEFKSGERVIVRVDERLAVKYPKLTAGDELACTITGRMPNSREPGYRVQTGPMFEFKVPMELVSARRHVGPDRRSF